MCACFFYNHAGDRQYNFLKRFSRLPLVSACAFTVMPDYGFVTETICFHNYIYVNADIQDPSGLLNIRLLQPYVN